MIRPGLLILFCYFLCQSTPVQAQFSDSVRYHLGYSGTGVINSTDAGRSYVLTNGVRLNMRHRRVDGNVTATWLYGENGDQLTNNDLSTLADLNLRSRLPRLYYWGLASFEKSYSLKVNNRTQAGLGVAYNILDRRDSLYLNVSNGILYEFSDLVLNDSAADRYSTYRNSFRLKLRYRFRKFIVVESTGFIQHSLEDGRDYIIRGTTSISLKLNAWMAFTTALTYNKVSRTDRENLLLTFGLTMETWL